jgi:hypothetical protein
MGLGASCRPVVAATGYFSCSSRLLPRSLPCQHFVITRGRMRTVSEHEKGRTAHIHVRVTPEEKRLIEGLAAARFTSVSELLRQLALRAVRRKPPV